MKKVKGKIKFNYDQTSDVLYLFVNEARPTSSLELESGIVIRYDPGTDHVVGATIVDYKARKNLGILKPIPYFEEFELPEVST